MQSELTFIALIKGHRTVVIVAEGEVDPAPRGREREAWVSSAAQLQMQEPSAYLPRGLG